MSKKMTNEIMLITYADSLGKDLKDLKYVLDTYLQGVIGGVHILPFFPSSGDRGFAPMTYQEVDSVFGTWTDIQDIAKDYYLMYDFMINHISKQSVYFQDFLKNKDKSPYYDYFIRYSDFWPNGSPTEEQVDLIYKRKPRAPFIEATFADGSKEKIWCTFDEEQIDLDVRKTATLQFIKENLVFLCQHGASIIRLDAFAYATKKMDTTCFFVEPDTWEIIEYCQDIVNEYGVELLPEIHEHYTIQFKIANHDYYIYDFALPMLVLHTLYHHTSRRLIDWIKMSPKKQFTTLDTHDGIGVVDVKDLMSDEEIERTRESLYEKGANVKKIYSTAAYNNLDIYQINCSYYSALGHQDDAYLLARAIQFFAPGIPQVYYVGLLAGKNDIELLEKTKQGRDINRHYYSLGEIDAEIQRPVVQKIFKIMRFRNTYPAFNGDIFVDNQGEDDKIRIEHQKEGALAILIADLQTYQFTIEYKDIEINEMKVLAL